LIDPDLEFSVRQLASDATTTVLEHIRIDPRALIDRIKHSDVWAGHASPRQLMHEGLALDLMRFLIASLGA
jgi:hypothetical protein